MRRKKTGYILLALLVITGLAGTISGSISGKERKFAISLMKSTKTDALKGISSLSHAQLDFKLSKVDPSARERIYQIASSEKNLWEWMQATLKLPSNSEKRAEIKLTDEQVVKFGLYKGDEIKINGTVNAKKTDYKSLNAAVADFQRNREQLIEYIRTTTEDLRYHIIQTPMGWIDGYQLYLLIACQSNRNMQQIEKIKEDALGQK